MEQRGHGVAPANEGGIGVSGKSDTVARVLGFLALGFTAAITYVVFTHLQQTTAPLKALGSTYLGALGIVTGQAGQTPRVA